MNIVGAMGTREGDTLTLTNSWAEVHITRVDTSRDRNTKRVGYIVEGEPECSHTPWHSINAAIKHALDVLALYQQGRCD
jgi:hypothetical protein